MNQTDALAYLGLKTLPENPDEIKKAYRELAKRVHPDSGGNDALFRLVNEAYEFLTGSAKQTTTQTQNKQAETHKEPPKTSWIDIITKPDFIVPFDTLCRTAFTGQTAYVLYKTHNIRIALQDIKYWPIKSTMTLTVQVKTYPTRLHFLFGCPPKTAKYVIDVPNNAMRCTNTHQSYIFEKNIGISVNRGYHRITCSTEGMPGQRLFADCSTWFRHSRIIKKRSVFPGRQNIILLASIRVHR